MVDIRGMNMEMDHRKLEEGFNRMIKRSKGIFIPLLAVFIVTLLIFFGFLFFVGSATGGRAHLTNVANLAALAALDGYVKEDVSQLSHDISPYYKKSEGALLKAENVITNNANSFKFLQGDFGRVRLVGGHDAELSNDGAFLTLGKWCLAAPVAGASDQTCAQCNGNYPCFVPNAVPEEQNNGGGVPVADAAQVKICNSSADPFRVPFVSEPYKLCATSVATIVERCVTFAVDTSLSTVFDSHYSAPPSTELGDVKFYDPAQLRLAESQPTTIPAPAAGIPPANYVPRIVYPLLNPTSQPYQPSINPSRYAFPFYDAAAVISTASDDWCFQRSNFNVSDYLAVQREAWCSMPKTRPASEILSPNPKLHYRSDYRLRASKLNGVQSDVYADVFSAGDNSYYAPQPLGSIFMAINAALRSLNQRTTNADKVLLLFFNRDIVAREPASGMASDLGSLIQYTNMNNRGLVGAVSTSEIQPNFITKGWFPRFNADSGATNVALALDASIQIMSAECSASSDKSIVLFTDGLVNCSRYAGVNAAFTSKPQYSTYSYACSQESPLNANALGFWGTFENQLVGNPRGSGWYNGLSGQEQSYVARLKNAGIHLVSVIAGEQSLPNTREYYTTDEKGVRSLTQEELANKGWGGVYEGWDGDYRSSNYTAAYPPSNPPQYGYDPGKWAAANLPRTGYAWGYPNVIFSGVSLETSGRFCPLRPRCRGWNDPTANSANTTPQGCSSSSNIYINDQRASDPQSSARILNPDCLFDWRASLGNCSTLPAGRNAFSQYCSSGLNCSLYDMSESEQAAKCTTDTVEEDPFILVAEKNIVN